MAEIITSINNSLVKETVGLYNRQTRDKMGLFLIEGISELSKAVNHQVQFKRLFYCEDILDPQDKQIIDKLDCLKLAVNPKVFERMTYRGTTGGLLAVAVQPVRKLEDIKLKQNPLLVVIEKMEKPGNVGAILRTADAAGVDAVIICDEVSDQYNPNTVRTSMGALFSTLTITATTAETITWLKEHQIKMAAATPAAKLSYMAVDMRGALALVIGSEKDGLSAEWLAAADLKILIPMYGEVDSLNASASAAIIIYEAVRQRHGA